MHSPPLGLPSRIHPLILPSLGRQPDVHLSPLRVFHVHEGTWASRWPRAAHVQVRDAGVPPASGLTSPSRKASFCLAIFVIPLQRRGPGRSCQVAGRVGDSWVLFMKSLRRHHPALWLLAGLEAAPLCGSLWTRGKLHPKQKVFFWTLN